MRGRDGLAELLGLGRNDDEGDAPQKLSSVQLAARADDLQEKLRSLQTKHEFGVGDLICLKRGMKNVRWPEYGEPVVVTEVLPVPVCDMDTANIGGNHFMLPKDIRIGHVGSDGEFNEYLVDSRRFRPWEPPVV